MKDSARYAKIVEWSEEDQCYVGSAPGLGQIRSICISRTCIVVNPPHPPDALGTGVGEVWLVIDNGR